MTTYQSQSTRVRQLFSTLAAVTASNPVLLEGEKWNEKDATTGRATGRSKTGDGAVSADKTTITGTAFNDLPFDPGGSSTSLSDATPQALGTAAAGTASTGSRSDHRHAMPTAAQVGADGAGTASAAVAAHVALADPHPTYTTAAEAAAAAPVQSVAGRTGAVTLAVADVSGAVSTSDSRLSDAREWSAATVTQTEAETGSSTTRLAFTPLRVFQAIAAWWAASAAKAKLDGIASGATANSSDATLLARANHTGTQTASTITDLATVATSGAYADLSGRPTLGTAAAAASTAFAASGAVTGSGLTVTSGRVIGRSTAGTGAVEEITIGTNLSFSGNTLNASGGGDYLAALASSEVAITTTATATISTQHLISGTTADYTVTLPAAFGNTGKFISFRISNTATRVFTIKGNASELIDGQNTRIMWAGEAAKLYCDGTGWQKIAGKTIPMTAFLKRVGSSQTISASTWTAATMDTQVSGFSRMFNSANGRVAIVRPGQYACTAYAYCNATGFGYIAADLNTPAGSAGFAAAVTNAASSANVTGSFSTVFSCAAGDQILTAVYLSGGTVTINTAQPPTSAVTEVPSW